MKDGTKTTRIGVEEGLDPIDTLNRERGDWITEPYICIEKLCRGKYKKEWEQYYMELKAFHKKDLYLEYKATFDALQVAKTTKEACKVSGMFSVSFTTFRSVLMRLGLIIRLEGKAAYGAGIYESVGTWEEAEPILEEKLRDVWKPKP